MGRKKRISNLKLWLAGILVLSSLLFAFLPLLVLEDQGIRLEKISRFPSEFLTGFLTGGAVQNTHYVTTKNESGLAPLTISDCPDCSPLKTFAVTGCANLTTQNETYTIGGEGQILNSTGTCIEISNNSITLDCEGGRLNYSNGAGTLGYGVAINGYDGVTIKNCKIYEGTTTTSSKNGVFGRNGVIGLNITNSTIVTVGASSLGIFIDGASSSQSTVENNSINTTGSSAIGLRMRNTPFSTVRGNVINTSAASATGIDFLSPQSSSLIENNVVFSKTQIALYIGASGRSNTIRFNKLFSSGVGTQTLRFDDSVNNTFVESNEITALGSSTTGVFFNGASIGNNTFLNNNISAPNDDLEISDLSAAGMANYLVYNNSFGEIRWINNGTGSFLTNLTLNVSGSGIGLDLNIFIGNNTAAVNTSSFTTLTGGFLPRINGTANITLRGLALQEVEEIRKYSDYEISSSQIIGNGFNCTGCRIGSYSGGVLIFNTTSFSSFSGLDIDIQLPVIVLLAPANKTRNTTDDTPSFFFNASDDLTNQPRLNCTLWINDTSSGTIAAYGTNNSVLNATKTIILSNATLTDGYYNWWVNCSDGTNSNISEPRNLSISANICGTLNGHRTLTNDVSSAGTCFTIGNSNLTLECAGYTITYGQSSAGYGIDGGTSGGYDNVTIKNCNIVQGSSLADSPAIFVSGLQPGDSAKNWTIRDNIITTSGSSSYGIHLAFAQYLMLVNNTITIQNSSTNGALFLNDRSAFNIINESTFRAIAGGSGISLNSSSGNNTFTGNTINVSGSSGRGVVINDSANLTFRSNNITIAGPAAPALELSSVTNSTFESNDLRAIIPGGFGALYITGTSNGNTFLNNNLSADSGFEILDITDDAQINYILYNNSLATIRWLDNGTGSFLRNLTLNGTLGYTLNLFLANNTAALNTSAFVTAQQTKPRINSTANITLYSLDYVYVDEIRKWSDFTTESRTIRQNGVDCLADSSCFNFSFSGGTLAFNVTSFSSYAAFQHARCGEVSASITGSRNFTSGGTCFNVTANNIYIDCQGYYVNYSMNGSVAGYGVIIAGYNNVTIKNCRILEGNESTDNKYGIYGTEGSHNLTIINNSITTIGTESRNIFVESAPKELVIANNSLNSSGSSAENIFLRGAVEARIEGNTINNTATGGPSGIFLDLTSVRTYIFENVIGSKSGIGIFFASPTQNSIVKSNKVIVSGSQGIRLNPGTNNDSYFESNEVTSLSANPAIFLNGAGIGNNTFVNNNLSAPDNDYEIQDDTGAEMANYLIYNNSFGEVSWRGAVQSNLTVNVSGNGLGLGLSIFVGNNTAAVNTSAFGPLAGGFASRFNSTANITLRGLTFSSVARIMKLHNYTPENATVIITAGFDCLNNGCTNLSYSGSVSNFNVSSLGSFAVSDIISNTLPTAPTGLTPPTGNTTTNRTPTFGWANSTDADGDVISYNLIIDDNIAFNNPEVNVSAIPSTTGSPSVNYTISTELDVDKTYYWKVQANDTSSSYGDNSTVNTITINSYLAVSVLTGTVAFGSVSRGGNVNTSSGNALPFHVENSGNIPINVTVTGTPYFTAVPFNNSHYQFRIEENESSSFDTTKSTTDWFNMTSSSTRTDVADLDWHVISNDFLTGLLIRVPGNESAGAKSSTVTFAVSTSQ
ncbi:right-handed parallel beta-helix repeat-containing protein [Candidatus Woesearchaeota archaeon]|nr:right-handed parallel beta-helix repeat-containing protein [Candidatus Woesearchaeota archaeon]